MADEVEVDRSTKMALAATSCSRPEKWGFRLDYVRRDRLVR
jgi:hypothetical protein